MTAWLALADRLRGIASLEVIAARLKKDAQRRRSLVQRMEVVAEASAQPDPQRIVSAAAGALHRTVCADGGGAVVFIAQTADDLLPDEDLPFYAAGAGGGFACGASSAGGGGMPAAGGGGSAAAPQAAPAAGAGGSVFSGPSGQQQPPQQGYGSAAAVPSWQNAPIVHVECASEEVREELKNILSHVAAECLSFRQRAEDAAGSSSAGSSPAARNSPTADVGDTPGGGDGALLSEQVISSPKRRIAPPPSGVPAGNSTQTPSSAAAMAAIAALSSPSSRPMSSWDAAGAGSACTSPFSSLRSGSSERSRVSLAHLCSLGGNLQLVTAQDVPLGVNAFSDWKVAARALRSGAPSASAGGGAVNAKSCLHTTTGVKVFCLVVRPTPTDGCGVGLFFAACAAWPHASAAVAGSWCWPRLLIAPASAALLLPTSLLPARRDFDFLCVYPRTGPLCPSLRSLRTLRSCSRTTGSGSCRGGRRRGGMSRRSLTATRGASWWVDHPSIPTCLCLLVCCLKTDCCENSLIDSSCSERSILSLLLLPHWLSLCRL